MGVKYSGTCGFNLLRFQFLMWVGGSRCSYKPLFNTTESTVFTARMNHYHTFYSSSNKGTVLLNYLICMSRMPLTVFDLTAPVPAALWKKKISLQCACVDIMKSFSKLPTSSPPGDFRFFFFKSINSYLGNLIITSQTARCVIGASIISTPVVCPVWQ